MDVPEKTLNEWIQSAIQEMTDGQDVPQASAPEMSESRDTPAPSPVSTSDGKPAARPIQMGEVLRKLFVMSSVF